MNLEQLIFTWKGRHLVLVTSKYILNACIFKAWLSNQHETQSSELLK